MNIYSLGYNCQVEQNLEKMQRKREKNKVRISTPFNWTITPKVMSILNLLESSNNRIFENIDTTSILHNGQQYEKMCCLLTNLIGFHEIDSDIERLQSKYQYLLKHMHQIVVQESDNVFFKIYRRRFVLSTIIKSDDRRNRYNC